MAGTQVAVVTGGSRGIGAAICAALAAERIAVVINYVSHRDEAEQAAARVRSLGAEALPVRADIGTEEGRQTLLQSAFDWKGTVHFWINNAAVAPKKRADILEVEEEEYRRVFEVNLHAAFFLTQQAVRRMLADRAEGKRRAVINISSVSAEMASPNRAPYCMTKAALSMLTQILAVRLANEGIDVYEIRPGIIATDMTAPVKQKYDAFIAEGGVPMRRWGTPEDVARAVATLIRGRLSFAPGQVIYADGGLHIARL